MKCRQSVIERVDCELVVVAETADARVVVGTKLPRTLLRVHHSFSLFPASSVSPVDASLTDRQAHSDIMLFVIHAMAHFSDGADPVTRVGPTGTGPQQKSSGPRQK